MRFKADIRGAKEMNPSVDRKLRRLWLSCPICPPNRGENSGRAPKHGEDSPRYKDKRR